MLERLALPKLALNTNGIVNAAQMSRIASASRNVCSCDSIRHGPAISANGFPPPISIRPICAVFPVIIRSGYRAIHGLSNPFDTCYGLHRPHRSRQKPFPHVPPGQCVLLMHGSPSLSPPLHVFTHIAPEPNAVTHTVGVVQATLPIAGPHVTADGHAHGPLNEYANCFTASTTATMSKALMSAFNSGKFCCICAIALIGALATFLNL